MARVQEFVQLHAICERIHYAEFHLEHAKLSHKFYKVYTKTASQCIDGSMCDQMMGVYRQEVQRQRQNAHAFYSQLYTYIEQVSNSKMNCIMSDPEFEKRDVALMLLLRLVRTGENVSVLLREYEKGGGNTRELVRFLRNT